MRDQAGLFLKITDNLSRLHCDQSRCGTDICRALDSTSHSSLKKIMPRTSSIPTPSSKKQSSREYRYVRKGVRHNPIRTYVHGPEQRCNYCDQSLHGQVRSSEVSCHDRLEGLLVVRTQFQRVVLRFYRTLFHSRTCHSAPFAFLTSV